METFRPNLVSPVAPISRYWSKFRLVYFQFLVKFLLYKNFHNFKTSNNIDMKLEPVNKLNRNTTTSKEIWRWRRVGKLWRRCHFFRFGQFGIIRKPKIRTHRLFLKFSLITTFCATKTENRTKISLTQPSYYCQGIS